MLQKLKPLILIRGGCGSLTLSCHFDSLFPLSDWRLPCRDLSRPTSPSGQMNYLSPPSISEAGIIGHGNLEFNTAVEASPWIRAPVNHPKAVFRRCPSFSDFPWSVRATFECLFRSQFRSLPRKLHFSCIFHWKKKKTNPIQICFNHRMFVHCSNICALHGIAWIGGKTNPIPSLLLTQQAPYHISLFAPQFSRQRTRFVQIRIDTAAAFPLLGADCGCVLWESSAAETNAAI